MRRAMRTGALAVALGSTAGALVAAPSSAPLVDASIAATVSTIPAPSTGQRRPRRVLVLYSYSRLLPASIEGDRGLRETLRGLREGRVELDEEFLEQTRFDRPGYDDILVNLLRIRYGDRPPEVIIAAGSESLQFLLRKRDELFPGAPVVYEGIFQHAMSSLPPLPGYVVGRPVDQEVPRTVELMLRLHPDTRRLVVITGAAPGHDRDWEAGLRTELARFEGRVALEFLAGLPHRRILERLRALDQSSLALSPGYFVDGEGQSFIPYEALRELAAASAVPLYGTSDTQVGSGVVGGYSRPFRAVAREAGTIVNQLLDGADPATLALPALGPPTLNLDWRQLERWNIDRRAIPQDAVLQFRSPSIWEAYRQQVLAGLVLVILQGALILGLLAERFRRRRAERAVETQRFELAHASRLAVAGELTAAIAHEINQPLGAILANADAAEMLLHSGRDTREALAEILADIRRDDLRASEVVRRLRALLARHEVERCRLDLDLVVLDALAAVRSEAARRGVALEHRPAPGPAMTDGDAIQLQQVLINLLLNGMDAVAQSPAERRWVSVTLERPADRVVIVVHDRGPGIPAEHLSKLFDSFFTTKHQGMGLGLSIARTIVEAHGGRIDAANHEDGGAVFRVDLPAVEVQT